jgi:hypothetical protein
MKNQDKVLKIKARLEKARFDENKALDDLVALCASGFPKKQAAEIIGVSTNSIYLLMDRRLKGKR